MAIAYRASSSIGTVTGGATSVSIAKPTGLAENDVMVMNVSVNSDGNSLPTITVNNWTHVRTDDGAFGVRSAIYTRVATSSDANNATSWTVSFSATSNGAVSISAYSGVNTTTPVDVHGAGYNLNGSGGANNDIIRAPSVTPSGGVGTNGTLLHIVAKNSHEATSPPTNYTERVEARATDNFKPVTQQSDRTGYANPTGTADATTSSGNSGSRIGTHLILAPAPTGTTVTSSRQAVWNTRGKVPKGLAVFSHTRAKALTARSGVWHIRAKVGVSRQAIWNSGQADAVKPTFTTVTVNGATLIATANEALHLDFVPSISQFTVTVAGSARTVTNLTMTNNGAGGVGVVTLTLASPVTAGQTVTLAYTQ